MVLGASQMEGEQDLDAGPIRAPIRYISIDGRIKRPEELWAQFAL